jgi:phytoene dehydrogenase-like protein
MAVSRFDAIVIGAGHNGLVTAAYLAKAGQKVLVLERRPTVGGIVATEEIYPGFKYSSCAHLSQSFSRNIIDDLELTKHGLETLALNPLLFAPLPDGNALMIPSEPAKIAERIGRFSRSDASKFESFTALVERLSAALRLLLSAAMPDGAGRKRLDISEVVKLGWRLQRLGQAHLQSFLRILPMSVADFLNEWFETEILKASLAATGLFGTFTGPRAQGTSYVYLHHLSGGSNGVFRSAEIIRGGMGNLPQAIARAAEHYGAEIRTNAEVQTIVTKDGKATGVMLRDGMEILATAVVSNADVKRTFLRLLEPTYLDPHFLLQVRNIRSRGNTAKINLALDRLPNFTSAGGNSAAGYLGGVIHIGPTIDYLERSADDAKYGRVSKEPFMEITIPSLTDQTLAPPGKHVMSIWMHSAPYYLREGDWHEQRDLLGDAAVNLLTQYAPGLKDSILHKEVLTPLDLEEKFGLTEGHLYHAELALDQIFFMRPVPGWARYRTPIEHLYLCGSGTHPGGGITGLPGQRAAKEILRDLKARK